MTNRLVKLSFSFLKIASFGLIIVYIAAVVAVGFAGHGSGDIVSFLLLFAYTVTLALLLKRFQRQASKMIRVWLLLMLVPMTAVLLFFVLRIIYEAFSGKPGIIELELLMLFILTLFVVPSCIVIGSLISRNWNFQDR
jgi:hypothetical protein